MFQSEADIGCPYCGEQLTVLIDPSEPDQEYIEDCQVCCRPIVLRVTTDPETDEPLVMAFHENDA